MADFTNADIQAYSDASDDYGKILKPTPAQKQSIGVDLSNAFLDNVIEAGLNSSIDIAKIESLTQLSNNRELIMELLDTMAEDPRIAAALEIYAEDATETNDEGKIVWATSDDSNIGHFVNYLLNAMNVDKHIYQWVYALCKYGDVYLRLYRNSEYQDDLLGVEKDNNQTKVLNESKESLNEDIIVKAYDNNDSYSHYVEMIPNPAEMFELTRMGKSYAYIKANIASRVKTTNMVSAGNYRYSFYRNDTEIFDPTNFVHAALEDNTSRVPEEIQIFNMDADPESSSGLKYTVRRGQSLLYNIFKIWRQLTLLENALLLNRVTRSSILRIIGVEVGDMPKERVGPHLIKIKQLVEQKTAMDEGNSISEYTNPGPVENNIYVPTHNGIGTLSTQEIGGDVNVGQLTDMDYFKNKLYSSLRIPKQFLGDTDDNTGFNGGTSLTLISSRYAKAIKRIQSTVIQALTDAVNLMLIDKGLDNYVNKFEIRMQAPMTQEEKDRAEAKSNRINVVQDIMNLLDGVDLPEGSSKVRILKSLLSSIISDNEVIKIIDEEIDKLLEQEDAEENEVPDDTGTGDTENEFDMNFNMPSSGGFDSGSDFDLGTDEFSEPNELDTGEIEGEETVLPLPNELDIGDMTDLNNENI